MKKLLILICLISVNAYAGWFCREGASRKIGEGIESCGIGEDANEQAARKKALSNAFEEFNSICEQSADCKNFDTLVEPMRTECLEGEGSFKCYRAFMFYLTKKPKNKTVDKSQELDKLIKEIAAKDRQNTDEIKSTVKDESDSIKKDIKGIKQSIENRPYQFILIENPEDTIKKQRTSMNDKSSKKKKKLTPYAKCMEEYEEMRTNWESLTNQDPYDNMVKLAGVAAKEEECKALDTKTN